MTLPRKARTICVGDQQFRWMVSKTSSILSVPVYVQLAEGQCSRLEMVYYVETAWQVGKDGQYHFVQKTSVTPANIRDLIQQAFKLGWIPSSSKNVRFRSTWNNQIVSATRLSKDRFDEIYELEKWEGGDPLAQLTSCLTTYGRPHPTWLNRWQSLCNAWQATADPGVMLDILFATKRSADLVAILRTFAFREGIVGDLLRMERMGFAGGTGWQRHLDGTNAKLTPEDKLRSIVEDIEFLSENARQKANIHDFRIHMIEATDIGTHGDWPTFCFTVANIIRSVVPEPPGIDNLVAAWIA